MSYILIAIVPHSLPICPSFSTNLSFILQDYVLHLLGNFVLLICPGNILIDYVLSILFFLLTCLSFLYSLLLLWLISAIHILYICLSCLPSQSFMLSLLTDLLSLILQYVYPSSFLCLLFLDHPLRNFIYIFAIQALQLWVRERVRIKGKPYISP